MRHCVLCFLSVQYPALTFDCSSVIVYNRVLLDSVVPEYALSILHHTMQFSSSPLLRLRNECMYHPSKQISLARHVINATLNGGRCQHDSIVIIFARQHGGTYFQTHS